MIYRAAHVTPSDRQLNWQKMEFYGFIHFGINTFTGREWGSGDEDPDVFSPSNLNPEQWVKNCRDAGMTGLILTAKHHDGFCLWPSEYTEHSVKNSSWAEGRGDVVWETAAACKKFGLKFGFYLSPWDQHDCRYGTREYNDYFKNQLRELLTDYGEIFCVWFDGACGEGHQGCRQVYDWSGYYEIIRRLQPEAVIANCGPDVRWIGNEAGQTRKSEWSVVPAFLKDREHIMGKSQQKSDSKHIKKLNEQDEDLGSRSIIKQVDDLIWYPAEVDTSIRPGWFYHPREDEQVRPLAELKKIYLNSVGGNACLLLNIPPDRRGLFHENDVSRLQELGSWIDQLFSCNLFSNADIEFTGASAEGHSVSNLIDEQEYSFWMPDHHGEKHLSLIINLEQYKKINYIVLQEYITRGQRVEQFKIEVEHDNKWKNIYQGTVIGYKKICNLKTFTADRIKITIEKYRWQPALSSIEAYFNER